jgi:hypothetical protein
MPTCEHSVLIDADRGELFTLTQDYGRRLAWGPFLREARLLGGAEAAAPGVRAWCVAWYGLGMETEYVTVSRVAAVRMTRGPWLLESFAGSWRFAPAGPGRARVTFRYRLTARPRRLRWLLRPLLPAFFGHDTRRRLRALKHAAERGTALRALARQGR